MILIQQIIAWCCILLLCGASGEDIKYHRVHRRWEIGIFLLGVLRLCVTEDNRWVTIALTCFCFLLWYILYLVAAEWMNFGGADVRLMTGCMLALGVPEALYGLFLGFCMTALYVVLVKKKCRDEIPLVPWMTAGIIVYEFIQKNIYFL